MTAKDLRELLAECDDDCKVLFYRKGDGAFDINALAFRKQRKVVELSDEPLPEKRLVGAA